MRWTVAITGTFLKLWGGDEQRLDGARIEGVDVFDVRDGVDFT